MGMAYRLQQFIHITLEVESAFSLYKQMRMRAQLLTKGTKGNKEEKMSGSGFRECPVAYS